VSGIQKEIKKLNYASHSVADELEQINTVFLVVKIGLILVGTIALIIASIGIYNTMTMAVTERAQDIGIMKAIGAHPKTVKSVFLIESSFIGALGALIGTIVAYIVSIAVNLIVPEVLRQMSNSKSAVNVTLSYIPASLTLLSVAISIGVAVLSGWRPAKRATQVDVLKALRRDI
jgi:acetoin utilization transport system permease protein